MSTDEIASDEPIDIPPLVHSTILVPPPIVARPKVNLPDLRITPAGYHNRQVRFILSKEVGDQAAIPHGDRVVLVFDSDCPNYIGLTWDPQHTLNRRTPGITGIARGPRATGQSPSTPIRSRHSYRKAWTRRTVPAIEGVPATSRRSPSIPRHRPSGSDSPTAARSTSSAATSATSRN
jgi:hypothetical protein